MSSTRGLQHTSPKTTYQYGSILLDYLLRCLFQSSLAKALILTKCSTRPESNRPALSPFQHYHPRLNPNIRPRALHMLRVSQQLPDLAPLLELPPAMATPTSLLSKFSFFLTSFTYSVCVAKSSAKDLPSR